jgi:hypothetical protein
LLSLAILFITNIFAALSTSTLSSPANGASNQNPNVSIDGVLSPLSNTMNLNLEQTQV